MTKRTNFILFFALFLPLFLQAQMQKDLFTMRPALYISKGEKRIGHYFGMDYGKMLNQEVMIQGGFTVNGGEGFMKDYKNGFRAHIGGQYYFLESSKWNPHVFTDFSFSHTKTAKNESIRISGPGNFFQLKDTTIITKLNEVDASIGVAAQYFLNENLAVVGTCEFTNYGVGKKTNSAFEQSIAIYLQPFYSAKSYKEANETKDFFYKGRTQIAGSLLVVPIKRGILNTYNLFGLNANLKYFPHKYLGVGVGLNVFSIFKTTSGIAPSVAATLNTETNIKLLKRLYLSPSLGVFYSHGKLSGGKTNISANLGFSYFINKNIAWNLDFLNVPIYNTETIKPKILYLNNSFSYYLK